MKRIARTLLIFFMFASIVSCADDEDPSVGNDDIPGALVATINGQSFDFRYQPRAYEGTYETGNTVYNSVTIGGGTNNTLTRELDITIVNPSVGTFEIDSEFLTYVYYQYVLESGLVKSYSSISGEVTVTEYGNSIKGSFNAILSNFDDEVEVPITGTFDLDITD